MAVFEGTSVKGSHLFYSCYSAASRVQEQFVHDHALTFILEGSLDFYLGTRHRTFHAGDIALVKRNQLAKATKIPPAGGVFRSVSLHLSQDVLRKFSLEYTLQPSGPYIGESVVQLNPDAFARSFVDSLTPYMSMDPGSADASLVELKAKEAILLILRLSPDVKDLLFDFSEPGKIDLEEFMSRHFTFNVEMKRFAYLTGRSLATFKRDFEKIFHTSPGKWLQQKRLAQAYYLIKEKGRKPSDVYLEVGFEDLSHFSFAFKKEYGKAPSLLN
ncbi:AraC family transcriptional regulator [Puia sp.]|uniref:helix-turn-helix domain-containing protein n=1 Tax=Puia sp. TaxID=2045100 RepID=UPI002F426884